MVLGVIGVWVASQWGTCDAPARWSGRARSSQIKSAAGACRSMPVQKGLYEGLTIVALASKGYHVQPFTLGQGESAYGLNVSIAPMRGPGSSAKRTTRPTAQLAERHKGVTGVMGSPS